MDFPQYATQAITAGLSKSALAGLAAYKVRSMYKGSTKHQLSALRRQVRLNRGELKEKSFYGSVSPIAASATVIELTQIPHGDNFNERIGQHIKLMGYKVRCSNGNSVMDDYIILSPTGQVPTYASFNPYVDSHLTRVANHHDFKELKFMKNNHGSGYVHTTRRFKNGMPVTYSTDSDLSCIRNRLFLVMKNDGTSTHNVQYNVVVYYYDK